jgi:ribonuclease P protein component
VQYCAPGAPRAANACPFKPAPGVLGKDGRARFGFGADVRLSTSAEYEHLLRHGTKRSRSGYTFYLSRRAEGPPRLGILISLKHAAKATVRNRIKRCIREAFRMEQAGLGSLDLLVRVPYGAKPGVAMLTRLRGLMVELTRPGAGQ